MYPNTSVGALIRARRDWKMVSVEREDTAITWKRRTCLGTRTRQRDASRSELVDVRQTTDTKGSPAPTAAKRRRCHRCRRRRRAAFSLQSAPLDGSVGPESGPVSLAPLNPKTSQGWEAKAPLLLVLGVQSQKMGGCFTRFLPSF